MMAAKKRRVHVPLGDAADGAEVPPLLSIATVADPGDNCAVAARDLPAGFRYSHKGRANTLSHHCLEAHRFTLEPVPKGGQLLSWGLPFGTATRDLQAGEYLMNELMLRALRGRRGLEFELPSTTNFVDTDSSTKGKFTVEEREFTPGKQVPVADSDVRWMGYERPGGRGVGTRNAVVLVGLTVQSAPFVRALEAKLKAWVAERGGLPGNVDCVCAVAHNEGGAGVQNNKELLLRVLSGFVVHPNTGAALVVGPSPAQTFGFAMADLRQHMEADASAYPLEHVPHGWMSLTDDWERDMAQGMESAAALLARAKSADRSPQPLSALRVAQQCGGSDAFSGLSGNPLTGKVSEMLIRSGGLALLGETPELVGAESYILDNCKDIGTARHFLSVVDRYKRYAERHGQDAAGNPSGGNLFRGLYNIALKSLGASRKKTPAVRLDRCVEYGERIPNGEGGYLFMDSPGNDLESIAGQVACGCNVIIFITGNGSITNFPFVPTLKFVTTTPRFKVLSHDMDVNAGRLVDGEQIDDMAHEIFDQMVSVCSGQKCKGELAGHSQVSVWRNWAVAAGGSVEELERLPNMLERPLGSEPHKVRAEDSGIAVSSVSADVDAFVADTSKTAAGTNLVLATSLCSGQVARLAAERLNAEAGPLRFAHLPNTEGCGGGPFEALMARVLVGHLRHPAVQHAFVLEHGCEKTHNDWLRSHLAARGFEEDCGKYGWGSCQLDGGVRSAVEKIVQHFHADGGARMRPVPRDRPLPLVMGIMCADPSPVADDLRGLAAVVCYVVGRGGTVVLPEASPLLRAEVFCADCLLETTPGQLLPATMAFAETPSAPGLHIMEGGQTMSWTELVTGMAASGSGCILTWLGRAEGGLRPGHPYVPTVHAAVRRAGGGDVDVAVPPDAAACQRTFVERVVRGVEAAVTGRAETRAAMSGAVDYSIPREKCAVSL